MKKPKPVADVRKDVDEVVTIMREVLDDRGVPRNIRSVIEDAMKKTQAIQPDGMNFSTAIYLLDDVSNDVNMPGHTRTDIWDIISRLESLKEKTK